MNGPAEAHEEHVAARVPQPARVHRHRLRPADAPGARTARPIAGQDDRAERVDVRDRVQREPAGSLRGVVAEPERDDAVADLVEDDRDDEAAEEDDGLSRGTAVTATARGQRRCDAQVMQSRAAGIASSRASAIALPQDSHVP